MSAQITRIEYRWDTTDADNAGWYAMGRDESGEIVDDSMKAWWPVDVDAYGEDGSAALRVAFVEAFPAAEVVEV